MVKYYLKLKFNSAKLYRDHKGSKVSYNSGELKDRYTGKYGGFIAPITYHQVANVLCALTGERPTNTLKYEDIEKSDYFNAQDRYIEWSKSCLINYSSVNKYFVQGDGKKIVDRWKPINEINRTAKAAVNSNVKTSYFTWFDIKYLLKVYYNDIESYNELIKLQEYYNVREGFDSFNDFINKAFELQNIAPLFNWAANVKDKSNKPVKQITNDIISYCNSNGLLNLNLGEQIKVMNAEKKELLLEELAKAKADENNELISDIEIKLKQKISAKDVKLDVITVHGYTFNDVRSLAPYSFRANNDIYVGNRNGNGIARNEVYSGEILVPIYDNSDLDLFRNGTGYSTILDGGNITISKLFLPSNINLDNFTSMAEIGDERILLTK